jgi:hypothetical protein
MSVTVGLRGNAIATDVPTWIEANGPRKRSCCGKVGNVKWSLRLTKTGVEFPERQQRFDKHGPSILL